MSDNPAKVKINLATEYWEEVLVCLPRHNLANQVALSCRLFSKVTDFLLFNMRRPVTLGRMLLSSQLHVQGPECVVASGNININNGEPCKCLRLRNKRGEWFNIPEQPLPENIVDFEELTIGAMDLTEPMQDKKFNWLIFGLMRRMFDNVNLWLRYDPGCSNVKQKLAKLWNKFMPFIGCPRSIRGFVCGHQYLIYEPFLSKTPFFHLDCTQSLYEIDEFFSNIVHHKHLHPAQAQQSCECRTIIVENNGASVLHRMIDIVLLCFSKAQVPITFFIRFDHQFPPDYLYWDQLVFARLLKARTGEQLCSEHLGPNRCLISRTGANVSPQWLANKKAEIAEWTFDKQQKRRRLILRPDYSPEI